MSRWKVFFIHAGTSYILLAARFAGTFILRLLVDPVTVGLINTTQIAFQIFAAITTGTIYTALRVIPSQPYNLQSETGWSHIISNTIEAAITILPFMFIYSLISHISGPSSWLILTVIGLFLIAQRFFAVIESLFMSFPKPKLVTKIRLLHIVELALALALAPIWGPIGYLFVTPIFAILALYMAKKELPWNNIRKSTIVQSFKVSRYALTIAAEKLLSAVASTLDSLFVSVVLGPSVLSGYFIGVSIRGVVSTVINSMYWTLWPKAVRDHDSLGRSSFADTRITLGFGLLVLFSCLVIKQLVAFFIIYYLKAYSHFLPSISIIIASLVPWALVEWNRARLVVEQRTNSLPAATLLRIFSFSTALLILYHWSFSKMTEAAQIVAWSSFISIFSHMLIITFIVWRRNSAKILMEQIIYNTGITAISAIVVGL